MAIWDIAGDAFKWGAGAIDDGASAIGGAVRDYSRVGRNNFNPPEYQVPGTQWGGEGGADRMTNIGLQGMGGSQRNADYAYNQAYFDRGPQAQENQTLSDREASSRYGDQSGAIQLAREAAMGQAPSEAAYAMQAGLNQSNAMQTAMAGGARGAAGIATAQGNAAGNVANSNQIAFNEAGRLRAQEMANARGLYGGLSGQQREQDLNRLGQGNQMSQFNAGLNDQYRMGMLGASNQAGQVGQGWYGQAQNPYNQQGQMDAQQQQLQAQEWGNRQSLAAGISSQNADSAAGMRDRWTSFGSTAGSTAAQGAQGAWSQRGGGMGGSVPKPT